MSVTFHITMFRPDSDEHTDFTIEPEEFIAVLKNQWPSAETEQWDAVPEGAEWRLLPESAPASFGYLGGDRQTITLDLAPEEAFERFILWYREFVPSNIPLHLFSSSDALVTLQITSSTTEEQIVDFAGLRR